jgi:capsular exopolysaccharide synthesis family protein
MILSAILGLVLAVAAAFFLEYMDSTVNTPERVWAAVSLSTLGIIPHLKSLPDKYRPLALREGSTRNLPDKTAESMSKEVVMVRDQISLTAESYRTIRTALLLSRAEQPPKVILLTSPCSGEGKTVTTVNLGMALAQSGQQVLVVDADLRRGRCHKLVNISNQHGLANVLAGQIGLRSAIQETALRNFFVLPRGGLPPNPADLLMSRKMNEVVTALRRSFDFVLIDTPPAIAVSDAAVVSALCDGALLVFHGQQTSAHSARQAVERLDSIGAKLLGIILNGVDIRNPDYVDYRSYYPSYYAAMQAESRKSAPGKGGGNPGGAAKDDVIYGKEDLDRVIDQLRGGAAARGAQDEEELKHANGVVKRDFFDRMSAALSEGLGPRAFPAMAQQVDYLRESMEAFPIARLWELTQLLSREIVDPSAKTRFLKKMSQEIRAVRTD